MGLLRRDLAGGKGLDKVIAEDAARFAELFLGFSHGIKGDFSRLAVQGGHKADGAGFHEICCIADLLVQFRFLSVDGVLHAVIQSCTDGKYFRVRH